MNADTDGVEVCARKSEETVGEHLDKQIKQCREHLESLVILKAKAETAQVLNYPYSFFQQIVYSHGF